MGIRGFHCECGRLFRCLQRWNAAGRWGVVLLAILCVPRPAVLHAGDSVVSEGSLHERIDALIARHVPGPSAERCNDATFIRRVTLDLTGRIPTASDVRTFLSDPAANKRETLVTKLMNSPEAVRHLATWLDVNLMERRAQKQVKADEWRAWLFQAVRGGQAFHELAAELFATDGTDAKTRPAVSFLLDRDMEPNLLTRDVGRFFFGRDLQCAQCHDHPLIADYHQRDYYGIYAFLQRSTKFTDAKLKKDVIADKPTGDADFTSVFTGDSDLSRPRLPGAGEVVDPAIPPGKEYKVAPAKTVRGIPTYSRRLRLADELRSGNPVLARTLANRLWAMMFRRGLVHPLDLDHPENPPVFPEVLEHLTTAVSTNGYRLEPILKELVLTQAYQRSYELPDESALDATRISARVEELERAILRCEQDLAKAEPGLAQSYERRESAQVAYEEARSNLVKARASLASAEKAAKPLREAVEKTRTALRQHESLDGSLGKAVMAAAAAAELVPDDAEVVKLAAGLRARADAAHKIVESTRSKLTMETAKWEPVAATKKAAERQVEADQKAFDLVAAPFRSARLDYQEHRLRRDRIKENLFVQQRRLEGARQELELANLLREQDRVNAELAQHQSKLPAAKERVAKWDRQAADSDRRVKESTMRMARIQQQHAEALNKQSQLGQQESVLSDAITAVEAVAAIQEINQELDPSTKLLQKSLEKYRTDRERFGSLSRELEQEMKVVAAEISSRQEQAVDIRENQKQAVADMDRVTTKVADAQQQLTTVVARLDAARDVCAELWSSQFRVSVLDGLTPEQLAWSTMRALGVLKMQRKASVAEVEKSQPLTPEQAADPAVIAERAWKIEQHVFDKLKGNVAEFVQLFGGAPGQPQSEFFATADQALFLANGNRTIGWLNPAGDNLAARLGKIENAAELADELYLTVMSRPADEQERTRVAEFLQQDGLERSTAIRELIWGLLASAEFRFHH